MEAVDANIEAGSIPSCCVEGISGGRLLIAASLGFFILFGAGSGAASRPAPAEPAASYVDPGNQFRIQVPDGWSTGTDVDGVVLRAPATNAILKIMPDPGCFEGTPDAALEVINARIELYSANPEFRVVEQPVYHPVGGHAAARAFAAHSESSSPVYLLVAVVIGPEWATVWTFAGFMNGASELTLASAMNATLDSFEAFTAPPHTTFSDAADRFTIAVHPGWTAVAGTVVGGVSTDALIASPGSTVSVIVASEERTVDGSYEGARPVLQEALDNLSTESGYQILEAPHPIAVDGHPGAQATVSWAPSTYAVVQVLVVLPAPEWGRFWGFVGTMFSWDAAIARSCIDATIGSFDIRPAALPPPAAPESLSVLQAAYPWLLAIALGATGTEGLVLGILIYRQRQRRDA